MLHAPPPAALELVHLAGGSGGRSDGGSVVVRLSPRAGASPDELAAELADAIESEASDHAEGWAGVQQYALRAVDAEGRACGEFAFRLGASALATTAADSLAELTPEQSRAGATPAALELMTHHPMAQIAAQQMRHAEALTRQVVELATRNAERDGRIIREQQQAIDRYARRERETWEIAETMLSAKAERDLKERQYADETSRKERLLERLNTLVIPAVAKRIGMPPAALGTGAAAGTAAATAAGGDTVSEIRRIFLSLPSELQDDVLAKLSDADRETLLSSFERGGATSDTGAKH